VAAVAVALAVLIGLGLLAKAATGEREVYTLGVPSFTVAAKIKPGERTCQEPIELPVEANAVVFPVATDARPGQPLDVTVRTASGRVLGAGSVGAGYLDGTPQTAELDRVVGPASHIAVCIRNDGAEPMFIYGSENVTSSGTITAGAPGGIDLDLRFLRADPPTFAASLPDVFERAALFRPAWVGAWVYWALLALLVLAAPVLLALALARAARDEPGQLP
jgi:hypothetical protein